MSQINKNMFNQLISLTTKHQWLQERYDELMKLLYTDCGSDQERTLVLNLIDRILYINSSDYKEMIKIIAKYIFDTYEEKNTIIYATATDRKVDSSQEITYPLKIYLGELGWEAPRVFGQINKLHDIQENDHIIVVDEFIGSGQTLKTKSKDINDYLRIKHFVKNTVTFICCVGSKYGIKALESMGINVQTFHELNKGISDYYQDSNEYIQIMRSLETRLLSEKIFDKNMPSLGYGEIEALYKREDGNTPNNVFPIFWWPRYKDACKRSTIMTRVE